MTICLPISHSLYPLECVAKAVEAYSGTCMVRIYEATDAQSLLEFQVPDDASDAKRVVHEFLNYLLDMSVETRLARTAE
ncbi:MAG: HxsD-like protein [Acidobacteria bacterium]|nr:HxsD-like protein [Acidobacteriota bacterium]